MLTVLGQHRQAQTNPHYARKNSAVKHHETAGVEDLRQECYRLPCFRFLTLLQLLPDSVVAVHYAGTIRHRAWIHYQLGRHESATTNTSACGVCAAVSRHVLVNTIQSNQINITPSL
jgi:hypothetical protein